MRAAILLFCACTLLQAADPKIRVQIRINCDNADLTDQFTSYLGRELRSLGDVLVTDETPDYKIAVTVVPSGKFFAASFLLMHVTKWLVPASIRAKITPKEAATLESLLSLPRYLFEELHVQAPGGIPKISRLFVAKIDSNYFSAVR